MADIQTEGSNVPAQQAAADAIHVPLHHRSLWTLVKPAHVSLLRGVSIGFFVSIAAETLASPFALLVEPSTDIGFCGGTPLKWFVVLFTLVGVALLGMIPYWYVRVAKPFLQEVLFEPGRESGSFAQQLTLNRSRRDATVFVCVMLVVDLALGLFGLSAAWPQDSGYQWTPPFVPKKPCGAILSATRFASVLCVAATFVSGFVYVMYFNYLQWRRDRPDRDAARAIDF